MQTGVNQKHGLDRGAVASTPADLRQVRATTVSACHRAATAKSGDGRFDKGDNGRADRAKERRCIKPLLTPLRRPDGRGRPWHPENTVERCASGACEELEDAHTRTCDDPLFLPDDLLV